MGVARSGDGIFIVFGLATAAPRDAIVIAKHLGIRCMYSPLFFLEALGRDARPTHLRRHPHSSHAHALPSSRRSSSRASKESGHAHFGGTDQETAEEQRAKAAAANDVGRIEQALREASSVNAQDIDDFLSSKDLKGQAAVAQFLREVFEGGWTPSWEVVTPHADGFFRNCRRTRQGEAEDNDITAEYHINKLIKGVKNYFQTHSVKNAINISGAPSVAPIERREVIPYLSSRRSWD